MKFGMVHPQRCICCIKALMRSCHRSSSKTLLVRLEAYFSSDIHFIPYISAFGGPDNPVTNGDDFFRVFTSHPSVSQAFEPEDIIIDEKRMVAVVLLKVALFESKTDKVLLEKHDMPRYQLNLDIKSELKIGTIHFFWEWMPSGVDDVYSIQAS